MIENNLAKILINEGIRQVTLSRATNIAQGTINRICKKKYKPSELMKNQITMHVNNLALKQKYDIEDIFPKVPIV